MNYRKTLTYYIILSLLFCLIPLSSNVLAAAPTVTTDDATGVEETTATLHGTLTDDGGVASNTGFNYGLTTEYGTDAPLLPTYIYAGGGYGIQKVYQYWQSNMVKKAETPAYGSYIYGITEDDTYIYYAGGNSKTIYQYWKSNMSYKNSVGVSGNNIYAVTDDTTYIYGAVGYSTNKACQYWKSNMTLKAQSGDYGANPLAIAQDSTYVYMGGGTINKVFQYWKSNMTKKTETASYGGEIDALAVDDAYIYVGGSSTNKVRQYWTSNMTYKTQSADYGGQIFALAQDSTYIYAGGRTGSSDPFAGSHIHQYWKSNMTLKAQSVGYGGIIRAIAEDAIYIYVGGATTNKVRQYYKSDMTLKAEADYGSTIYAISSISLSPTYTTGNTFYYDAIGLTPGKLYHFKANATNSDGTGYGSDKTFLTKPNEPASLVATALNRTKINLTWTKGTGANNTVVLKKTGSYPTSVTDGTIIYNNTGSAYNNSGLFPGTTYYYRAWSFTTWSTLQQWSDSYSSASTTTTADVSPMFSNRTVYPTSGSAELTTFQFNVSIKDTDDAIMSQVRIHVWSGTSYNESMTWISGTNLSGTAKYIKTLGPYTQAGLYNYEFLAFDGWIWNTSATSTFTVNVNTSFSFNFPTYLEVGAYILAYGWVRNATGYPINNIWCHTKILDSTDFSVVPFSSMACYLINGFYQYCFSTSTMLPGIYYVNVNFTYQSTNFSANLTLYLSYPGGPGHTITDTHFTYYNANTGIGIDPISFKLYVDDSIPLTATDRIYQDTYYNAYTGQTLYYKVLDYFDNKIYPLVGDQASVLITAPNQFVDIPIDWKAFSVKNMNHSIVKFTLANGSRSIVQYLFPYEPFYWNLLPGLYNLTMDYYDANTGNYEETKTASADVTTDTYYWIRGYDLNDIIIEIQVTNSSLNTVMLNITTNLNVVNSTVNTITTNILTNLAITESNITLLLSNIASYINIFESNITNQVISVWASINNTNSTIHSQINGVWLTVNNTNANIVTQANIVKQSILNNRTTIINQINQMWQEVNNTNTTIGNQLNAVVQSIINEELNITTQVNGVWSTVNNTNSTIHTELNSITSQIINANSTIHNQINTVQQMIVSQNSNITTQINSVITNVNNANSTIHTQINSVITDIQNVNSSIHSQITITQTMINNLESNITTQINSIDAIITNTESNITYQINLVWTSINNTNTSILTQINAVSTKITNTESNITNQLNNLEISITNTESNITNQINNININISNVNTSIQNQLNSIITDISNTNATIVTQANLILNQITNTESTIVTQLNAVQTAISNSESNITAQVNIVLTNLSNVNSSINGQLNVMTVTINNIESNLTAQINTVELQINNFEGNITTQINTILSSITNTETNISTQINIVKTQINNQNSNLTNQFNYVETMITNSEGNITNQVNSVSVKITNTEVNITNQINAVLVAISNNNTNIVNQLNLIWNSINNTNSSISVQITGVHTTITTMWSNVNYSFSVIQSGIINTENNITNLITDMNASLYIKLVGVLDNVSQAGVSVFDKTISILNNLSNINTSLHDELLNSVLNIVNNISGLNSTLFAEIQNQALVIMNNITVQSSINFNTITNLSNTIGKLISGNLSTMIQDIFDNVTNILSGVNNLTINITGNLTVDLSSVLENLSDILSELSLTNISLGNLINVSIEDLTDVTITMWESHNQSFIELKNRSVIMFNFYNTNEGLGLPWETLKIYINGSRLVGNLYYCDNGSIINVTIKDYYNFTMYTGNFTIIDPFTFLDFGLTFHSWKFCNKNDDYYMVSFLRQNATRWYERGICPYETIEFLLPSGNYTMRIYDKNWVDIHNQSYIVNRSMVYIISGTNLSAIIAGQSVIVGQLLELRGDFTIATTPDLVRIVSNIPYIYSVFDTRGAIIGIIKICPYLVVTATTTNSTYTNCTMYPLMPKTSTTNGTIRTKEDVLYFEGGDSAWVNVSETDGTLIQNTSYRPTKLDLFGENITVRSASNITLTRETTYQQQKKFSWTKFTDTLYYTVTVGVSNLLNTTVRKVYVYIQLANDTQPDITTVKCYDVTNGVYLTNGMNFRVSNGIEFYLDSLTALETRQFTCSYYGTNEATASSDAITIVDNYDLKMYNNKNYWHLVTQWVNTGSSAFIGNLNIQFNFDTDYTDESGAVVHQSISPRSFIVFDKEHSRVLDRDEFVYLGNGLSISQETMGTVNPNGARSFDVYFLFVEAEEQTDVPAQAKSWLKTSFWGQIEYFHVIMVILGIMALASVDMAYTKRRSAKNFKVEAWIAFILAFIMFILWIWYTKL